MSEVGAIRVQGAFKRFGSLAALDGVDLEVQPGEFFGLLGPNGAGKTTLISAIAGLLRLNAGRIEVMGHDVVADYRSARKALGIVPQELVFDPFFGVRELLRIQSGYFGLTRNDDWIDELLDGLDLTSKAGTNTRALSGGMKRRLLVAQALVHRPAVIVLDEPTAGVDVELRQALWRFIRRLNRDGHTIILTTHYLEEAEELCGRIGMLKAGRLVALDATADILQRVGTHVLKLTLKPDQVVPAVILTPSVTVEGDVLQCTLGSCAEVEPILRALREGGVGVLDMEITRPDLERAFVHIVGGGSQ